MKLILQSIKSMIRGIDKRIDGILDKMPKKLTDLENDLLAQPDYEQNDDTKPDYIKNRPFHHTIDKKETLLLEDTFDINIDTNNKEYHLSILEEGAIYRVVFDGIDYKCVARIWDTSDFTAYCIGNTTDTADGNPGNDEPFGMISYPETNFSVLFIHESGTHSIAIYKDESTEEVITVEDKYLPAFQKDYNQNDETQLDYIKNRPFYRELIIGQTIFDGIVEFNDAYGDATAMAGWMTNSYNQILSVGKTYNVAWDDKVYKCLLCSYFEHDRHDYYVKYPSIKFESSDLTFTIQSYNTGEDWQYEIYTNDMINTTHHVVITEAVEKIHKRLDSKFLPEGMEYDGKDLKLSTSVSEEPISYVDRFVKRYLLNQFLLTDEVTGLDYVIKMHDGEIIYYKKCTGIRLASDLTNLDVVEGGVLDTTGMVIMGSHQDETENEITNYKLVPEENGIVKITYEEAGEVHSISVEVNVIPIEEALIDFDYTTNEDGTYTITGWKGTLNGETSTRLIVPNSTKIIV